MLTEFLLRYTLDLGAEWVLWLLVLLGLINGAIVGERALFFKKRSLDARALRQALELKLREGDLAGAAGALEGHEGMAARVTLFGLRDAELGEGAVRELMAGALATERTRYERGLAFLGTIGNNAPFIGLFGTVLGIIGAFDNLGDSGGEASQEVMKAISEALVATGVGLLVAIPAVVAFNIFRSSLKATIADTELVAGTLLAHLSPRPASAE